MKVKRLLEAVIMILLVIIILMFIGECHEQRKFDRMMSEIKSMSQSQKTETDKEQYGEKDAEEEEEFLLDIDFGVLKRVNKDICAWIKIPGTNVDYPVLQRKTDNKYYIRRDAKGRYALHGSLYTENYNTQDFDDKVTVIYGHNMESGDMFGEMKNYSRKDYFKRNSKLYLYLPESIKRYQLVAAVPFDNRHLLSESDYKDKEQFKNFSYELTHIRDINAMYAEDAQIDSEDKLLILSTCYFNNSNRRFLIIWKELESGENEKNA